MMWYTWLTASLEGIGASDVGGKEGEWQSETREQDRGEKHLIFFIWKVKNIAGTLEGPSHDVYNPEVFRHKFCSAR